MALVDFNITFDLRADYKLTVSHLSVTGVALDTVTARVEVDHPNGLSYNGSASNDDIVYDPVTGDFTYFSTPLYKTADGQPYEGLYNVRVVVYSNGTYYSAAEKSYQLMYDPVTPSVLVDFDVFSPRLVLMDNTPSYEQAGFTLGISKAWDVQAPAIGASWNVTNSDAVDLVWNGNYYDTYYDSKLTVSALYQDNTYPWAKILDEFVVEDTYHAYTPPTLSQLLEDLTAYKRVSDAYLGKNNILYNKTKQNYDHMWAVFHHLVDKLCGGSPYSSELNVWLEEILTGLADGNVVTRTHTNDVINAFDTQGFCDGGGAGGGNDKHFTYVQAIPATIWNVSHNLGKKPTPVVVNDSGEQMFPELIEYIDDNNIRLTFLDAVTGTLYLN